MYIPKTVEGDKLEAAKKFIAFTRPRRAATRMRRVPRRGPFMSTHCKLPADVLAGHEGHPAYFDAGKAGPALEFKSPIKGPALEQICIQVGTGQVSGDEGRRALRPGREEAGPAVGPSRAGSDREPVDRGYCSSDSTLPPARPPVRTGGRTP